MNNRIILFTKNNANHLGFTLIEILITMTITSIVSAGIFTAYQSQQNTQLAQSQTVEMQQNLRAALYIMTSEIRLAGYDPSKTNGAGIVMAGNGSNQTNRFTFTYFNADAANDGTDNDNDGTTNDADETLQAIEYYLYDSVGDGTMELGRRNGSLLDAIAENIQTLTFTYQDINGNVTAIPSDIRSVQITVEATTDANEINRTNGTRTLTTTVKCRNLGI